MGGMLNLPQPGAVVTFRQQDVYLGDADLTLRLKSIGGGRPVHHQLEWVSIEGMALNDDGSDRGDRTALVRLAALRPPVAKWEALPHRHDASVPEAQDKSR